MVLNWGVILPPRVHLAMSGGIFGCHIWRGAAGIYWEGASDAAECPKMKRIILPTNNYPAQNVHSAEVENPRYKAITCSLAMPTMSVIEDES